jgi:hypothetical protein
MTKLASLQGTLLQLVANRPDGHALSWGDIQKARDSAGDVPDEILEPVLTWLGVEHPLRPPEKHTRWASPGEYQREVAADAAEIIQDLPRDKVKTYLEALDEDDFEEAVDWSEFGDDFDTRLDETTDQAVTYTSRQYEILLWSRNEDAIDDVGAELGEDSATAITNMAYWAYRQDLMDDASITNSELAKRHGFRLDLDENGDLLVVDLRA